MSEVPFREDPAPPVETVPWWRVWEALFGLVLGLAAAWCFHGGWLADLENRTIDQRFQSRGAFPQSGQVVLVEITDECIEKLGSWPWPRATHARLLSSIKQDGARVIGFDFLFNEPSLRGNEDDAQFAAALQGAGNVVLPITIVKKQVLDPEDISNTLPVKLVAEHALPAFRGPEVHEGFIDMEHQSMNRDGVMRHLQLERKIDDQSCFLFGLVIASQYLGQPIRPEPDGVRMGERFLPYYTRYERSEESGWVSSFQLNFHGRAGHFIGIPFWKVLAGEFPQGFFRHKAVIVGTRAKGAFEDVKFSPFGALPGMEIHAHLLGNILEGRFLRRLPPWVVEILIVLLGAYAGVLLAHIRGTRGNLLTLGVVGGWLGGAWALFSIDWIVDVVPVLILIPVQWTVTRLVQQFYDLRQRNRELAKKVRELSIVNEVSQAVNFMGDLNKTLDTILSRAVQALGAERGSLLLLDDRYEALVEESVTYGVGEKVALNAELKSRFKIGEGIAGEVFQKGTSRLIQDVRNAREFASVSGGAEAIRSMICVPLQVRDAPIGVMNVVNKSTGRFDHEDLQLALTMANQAAVVIEKARLFNLATIDGLTGLIVHRHFQSKIEEEYRRARRYDKPLSFLMTDIDHFKKFNDTWGHQTGDLVLREVAKIVRSSIRDTDVAARYGGEEFAVILPETDLEGATQFAERLRQRVEVAAFPGPAGDLKVTISIGLSSIPTNPADAALEMIRLADEALYDAKHSGRNRVGICQLQAPQPA